MRISFGFMIDSNQGSLDPEVMQRPRRENHTGDVHQPLPDYQGKKPEPARQKICRVRQALKAFPARRQKAKKWKIGHASSN